jgi:hypothetical protein
MGPSAKVDGDFQDRDYKPPPKISVDHPLSMITDIPRRSVRTVMLQTRPKEVDDRERRRETYLYTPATLLQVSPKPAKTKAVVAEPFVEELDNFTCRWKGCTELNEFEDLEALSEHLLMVHIKTQKGLRGKRKNARGFICEWKSCEEDKPFHGVREVQSHLRARHFGTKQVASKRPSTRPSRSHKRNQKGDYGNETMSGEDLGYEDDDDDDDDMEEDDVYQEDQKEDNEEEEEEREQETKRERAMPKGSLPAPAPQQQPQPVQPVKRKRGRPPMTPEQRAAAAALREQKRRRWEAGKDESPPSSPYRGLRSVARKRQRRDSEDASTGPSSSAPSSPYSRSASPSTPLPPSLQPVSSPSASLAPQRQGPAPASAPPSSPQKPQSPGGQNAGSNPGSSSSTRSCSEAAPKKRFLMRLGLGPSAQTSESIG